MFSLLSSAQSKQQSSQKNFVLISPTDTESEIIRKAANVRPSARQFRWQQLELTAFFHFGINTFTDREWGDGKEDPKLFNPKNLDAKQWVQTVRNAGFKQVIITAKHHDGFCLWPSKYTKHSVKYSPWKNGGGDVVKEVADACREMKMGFGIYLSPWDRNAPMYGTEAYNDFFINQLTELLTAYGRVDEVWFDGANGEGPNGKKQVYDFDRWYKLIRKLQPSATIAIMGPDVRWVGTETGKGREMEWSVLPADENMLKKIADESQSDPTFAPNGNKMDEDLGSRKKLANAKALVWYPAETDVSIRPGWFYHASENSKVKSPEELLDVYFSSVGYNSVLLLNIPPSREGLIANEDVKTLKAFGSIIKNSFRNNLLRNSLIACTNGLNMKSLTDDIFRTYFTTKGKDTTTIIEFTVLSPITFDVLSLQENIVIGQRIESFAFEYLLGDEWKEIAAGSTVGYKRLIRFHPVTAKRMRLKILASRLNPTLSGIGLYKIKGN